MEAMTVIQDKASSLIWGMPGKAFALNSQVEQLPLNDISEKLLHYAALDNPLGKWGENAK